MDAWGNQFPAWVIFLEQTQRRHRLRNLQWGFLRLVGHTDRGEIFGGYFVVRDCNDGSLKSKFYQKGY